MHVTVNASRLTQPGAVAHYMGKDPSYLTGMRFALETLGIDLPEPLKRKAPGRKRSANPCIATRYQDVRKARMALLDAKAAAKRKSVRSQ